MTARTMTISVGKRAVKAVVCEGINDGQRRVICGELRTHSGYCHHCGAFLTDAEFTAAIAAAEAGERAA